MTDRPLKNRLILSVLVCITLAVPHLKAAPLDLGDLTRERDVEESTESQLYEHIFLKGADQETYREIWKATYLRETVDITSSSYTTQYRLLKSKESNGKDIAKFIWKAFAKELQNEFKSHLTEWNKSSTQSFGAYPAVGTGFIPPPSSPTNRIYPKLKLGSDFVKPEIVINNSLGLHIDLGASYHTGEQALETKLLKEFTSDLRFTIQNIQRFDQEVRSDHLFGIELEF